MARMRPEFTDGEIDVRIKVPSERAVYKACRDKLPERCLVYYSVRTLFGTRPREHETDFAVFDPDHGLLVVEAKGGHVQYDARMVGISRLLMGR